MGTVFGLATAGETTINGERLVTQQRDDDEKPPPCPWCLVSAVREITARNRDTRWFLCQSCSRAFSISFEPQKPPS